LTLGPTRAKRDGNYVEFEQALGEIGIDDHHRWDDGNSVPEHLADIDDLIVARAIYEAACKRWPGERITLRQDARVIEDSRKTTSELPP
jgi:hypothetical protein